jgi:hypothetical protein
MVSNELMVGEEGLKTFSHNMIALQNKEYFLYGQCIAMSLLQGSPGPKCFSPSVMSYILDGDVNKIHASVDEVPDYEMRQKLLHIKAITDSKEFEDAASFEFNERFSAGYCKPIVQMVDKEEFLRCMILNYSVSLCQAELDQFVKGLELHNVLTVLRYHPNQSRKLFQGNMEPLTAEMLDDMFTPELSPVGNIKREREEEILFNFTHFVEEIEKGKVQYIGDAHWSKTKLTLGSVLSFVTGATSIPALGFDTTPVIKFDHDAPVGWKPTANTCANELTLPVNTTLKGYDSFKTEMVTCLQSAQGFGML